MKTFIILALLAPCSAYGLFSVAGNFSTETTQIAFKIQDVAQHAKTMAEWKRNYETVTKQLDTMGDQLEAQLDVKNWLGNPIKVELPSIEILSVEDFLDELKHGVSWESVIENADGTDSLEETHGGIFVEVEATTVTGEEVAVSDAELKKYAVVDQQYTNYVEASVSIDERLLELQENQGLALEELEAATTDAEVQKLSTIVNAQNGQIALLISEREKQYQRYLALTQLNENQEAKAKAVSIKAQLKDQSEAMDSLQSYLDSITKPDSE